ncbi:MULTISPECIES: hypothetical protein [Kocuria]|uniref:hypothetical protein n=1 Tax=Kocuria TaxID=57493 RepID=UPI000BF22B55|nr:hypothetical protein [Kocuria sp. KRD140]
MDTSALDYVVTECKALLETRFPDGSEHGAAVAGWDDPTAVVWKRLADLLPDYWLTALTGDARPGWLW